MDFISFDDFDTGQGKKPAGEIKATDLWPKVQVAFGRMSLSDAAMISRASKGMSVTPVFGRPRKPKENIDVFVLMPFKTKMANVYTNHIKKMGDDLGVSIRRADDNFLPGPFMEKVWDGICAAQLILADCTEKNPNVFYEIVIAHAVGKKVMLITRSEKDIPSDIKNFDYISYVYDPEGTEQLIEKLSEFIKSYFRL